MILGCAGKVRVRARKEQETKSRKLRACSSEQGEKTQSAAHHVAICGHGGSKASAAEVEAACCRRRTQRQRKLPHEPCADLHSPTAFLNRATHLQENHRGQSDLEGEGSEEDARQDCHRAPPVAWSCWTRNKTVLMGRKFPAAAINSFFVIPPRFDHFQCQSFQFTSDHFKPQLQGSEAILDNFTGRGQPWT
jgi:hypothetical protein